jgi:hypothetical protein
VIDARSLMSSAERLARIGFSFAIMALLVMFAVVGKPPYGVTAGAAAVGLVVVIARHLRSACRLRDPAGALHAEILSVSAALLIMTMSAIIRRHLGLPLGIIDLVAGVAALYLVWRLRVTTRHLRDGTLPAVRESGIAYARRTLADAWALRIGQKREK